MKNLLMISQKHGAKMELSSKILSLMNLSNLKNSILKQANLREPEEIKMLVQLLARDKYIQSKKFDNP